MGKLILASCLYLIICIVTQLQCLAHHVNIEVVFRNLALITGSISLPVPTLSTSVVFINILKAVCILSCGNVVVMNPYTYLHQRSIKDKKLFKIERTNE